MNIDYTLNSTKIKNFFDGDGDAPVEEFLYIMEHPLVRPNFLSDISRELEDISTNLFSKNITGELSNTVTGLSVEFAKVMSELASNLQGSEHKAEEALKLLKKIRSLCKSVA